MSQNKAFSITWSAIFKVAIAVASLYVLFIIKDILLWFIFALIIGILFNYIIDILDKKRIPRILSAVFLYFTVFALLSFFIYKTAPLLLGELEDFTKNLPYYLSRISPFFERVGIEMFQSTETFLGAVKTYLEEAGGSVPKALFSIFGGATSTILVLVMSFFISLERRFIERCLGAFAPANRREYVFNLWARAKQKVSGWFLTRLIGVLFVGAASYIVLSILDVKYAFVLSVIAGLFDLVPIVGPTAAGLIIFFIVSLTSLPQAVFIAIAFVIIQQLENNLLFPILFKRFVGISPVLVLIALAVGGKLWGVAGAILAIPMAGVLFELLKDYLAKVKQRTALAG